MSSKIAIKERPNISLNVISSKLFRVFDASAASSITLGVGNNVTSWINIAPNATSGTNATQSVSANQPVYDSVNRRINFGSGIGSRFLNFEGFGGTAFVGSIYIGTNAGVYAYNINVPSNANSSWEWGRVESNIFVTGIVITNQILTESEENIVNLWLGTKNSYGFVNFPSINITSLFERFRADLQVILYDYITTIKYVPNTTNVTTFHAAWYYCSSLTSFPLINTAAGTSFQSAWGFCTGLTSFPLINTAAGIDFSYAWDFCSSLTPLSLDNILISLAAGLSNNPDKTVNTNSAFAGVSTVPTNINIDATALINISQSFGTGANQVTYNFTSGISGQQARLWMLARGVNFSVAAPAISSVNVTRAYLFSSFGTSISVSTQSIAATTGSGTPTTATTFNLVNNKTTHGLGTIQGQSNSGLLIGGLGAGTYTIFVGTTQGYYSWSQTLAASTTYRWTGEQSGVLDILIVSGTITSGTGFDSIINRLTYHGALQPKTKASTDFVVHSLTPSSITTSHEASYISFLNTRHTGAETVNGELNWFRNSGTGNNVSLLSVQGNATGFTTTTATVSGITINTLNFIDSPIQLAGTATTTFHIGTTANRYSITPNLTSNYQALNYFWTGRWGDNGVRAIVQRSTNDSLPTDIGTMFDGLGVGTGTTVTDVTQNYPRYTEPFADQALQSRTVASSGATPTSIPLNSSVTLNANTQYNLEINGAVRLITTGAGTVNTVTVNPGFNSTPASNTAAYISAINLENKLSNFNNNLTNYSTPTVTQLTSAGSYGGYAGGVLAPNDRIYGIPYSNVPVLEITPLAGGGANVTQLTSAGSYSGYFAGVLAPNGRIYGIPYSNRPVLEINVEAPSGWLNANRELILNAGLNKL